MSTRIDYTAEEWSAISAAPRAARMFMGIASAGAKDAGVNESPSMTLDDRTAVAEVPELIRVVLNGIRDDMTRPVPTDGLSNDGAKYVLLNTVKTAVQAVEMRSPVEVEAFKAWLACVAAKASRTSDDQSRLTDGQVSGQPEEVQLLADVLAVGGRQLVT